MELTLLVYGIGLLVNITTLLIFTIFASVLIALFAALLEIGNYTKIAGIVCICSALLLTVLPSEKTAYLMVGAYAAQKIAENNDVQKLSGKVLIIIEQKMDKYIAEGTKNASK